MSAPRKIVAIATSGAGAIRVLCDDGTLWFLEEAVFGSNKWKKIEAPPIGEAGMVKP